MIVICTRVFVLKMGVLLHDIFLLFVNTMTWKGLTWPLIIDKKKEASYGLLLNALIVIGC